MLNKLVRVFGGDPNKRQVEKHASRVAAINSLESRFEAYTDEQLQRMTVEFRRRLARGETLDDLLIEAFAVVREASKRTLGQRHYDVQLIGGMVLHEGKIAEMRTGEGKTLVATLPLYLNALKLNPKWVSLARRKWGDDPDRWEFIPLEDTPVICAWSPARKPMPRTSPMAPTASLASITCGTTWQCGWKIACSAVMSTLSSTKWIMC